MKPILGGGLCVLAWSCAVSTMQGQIPEASPAESPAVHAEPASPGGKRPREFQGDDLGQVLRLLARQAKINLMVDDAIKGNINMRLEDVTAMDAIEAIARQYKLSLTKDDKGIYYLSPPEAADSALDFIAKPETANRIAAYEHNLYTALIRNGFSPDDALKIVVSVEPGKALATFDKKAETHP